MLDYDDNPGGRPRKHADASERQAAYRARGVTLEFRADEKTAATLIKIAHTVDVSRAELLLSMTKFALANHDWARFGLTHKTLPRYEGNPMASAAQLAAQKRFAAASRAGTLKRAPAKSKTRMINPRAKTSRVVYQVMTKTARGQWEVWSTVDYLDLAKEIAHRCASDPALRGRSIKVESFSVTSK